MLCETVAVFLFAHLPTSPPLASLFIHHIHSHTWMLACFEFFPTDFQGKERLGERLLAVYRVCRINLICFAVCLFLVFFFPTANFPMDVVDNLPEAVSTGIYYGWASVDRGPVYKMVMSIGWNPFYNNTKKSMVGTTVNMCE